MTMDSAKGPKRDSKKASTTGGTDTKSSSNGGANTKAATTPMTPAIPTVQNGMVVRESTNSEPEVLVGPSGPTEAGIHSVLDGIGCQQEYQFRYIRGIREPRNMTPDHFAIGSSLHAGKARWFSRRFANDAATWTSIQTAMREEMENERLPVSQRALQMAARYMREYIDYWSKRPRPTPIACEYKLGPTPLEKGDPFFMWRTARLDDVSKYPEALGKLCLGETKSTSDAINGVINKYTLHPQILLQMLLWKMDPNGEAKFGPIHGVMLDIIKKGYGEDKSQFARHFIPVPQHAMTWFPRTLKAHLRILSAIDWDTAVIRNPTRCTRQEGRMLVACEFRDLCLAGRNAANRYVMGKGDSLLSFKPTPGKTRPPWE